MSLEDFDSLTPGRDFSRRDFVRPSIGSGFAAAVLPVMAQTVIKTDSAGLLAGAVTIAVGDVKLPAYREAPAGKPNVPVVLVISEIFGVHDYIAGVARRLAKQGYFALAPELFVRQGDAGAYGEISKLMSEVIAKVPDVQVMGDLDTSVAWARGQGCRHGQIGYHRLLLGWAHHLAVRRAQPGRQCRRSRVWPAGGANLGTQPGPADRPGRPTQRPGAGLVQRERRRHSARID